MLGVDAVNADVAAADFHRMREVIPVLIADYKRLDADRRSTDGNLSVTALSALRANVDMQRALAGLDDQFAAAYQSARARDSSLPEVAPVESDRIGAGTSGVGLLPAIAWLVMAGAIALGAWITLIVWSEYRTNRAAVIAAQGAYADAYSRYLSAHQTAVEKGVAPPSAPDFPVSGGGGGGGGGGWFAGLGTVGLVAAGLAAVFLLRPRRAA